MFNQQLKTLTLMIVGSVLLISCGDTNGYNASSSSTPTTTTAPAKTSTSNSPLYLTVSTEWESGSSSSTKITQLECLVDSDATVGTVKSCTVNIPEGLLHFSKTHFKVGTADTSKCPVIHFQPYYYQMSTSATFDDPFTPEVDSVDCSGATDPAPAECYNGAARYIMGSDFPSYRGTYMVTSVLSSYEYSVSSPNSLGQGSWNKLACNNKSDPTTAMAYYIANSMVDYKITCRDQWAELQYEIDLVITDDDTSSGTSYGTDDLYPSWP